MRLALMNWRSQAAAEPDLECSARLREKFQGIY
jgi:hypothetical protein